MVYRNTQSIQGTDPSGELEKHPSHTQALQQDSKFSEAPSVATAALSRVVPANTPSIAQPLTGAASFNEQRKLPYAQDTDSLSIKMETSSTGSGIEAGEMPDRQSFENPDYGMYQGSKSSTPSTTPDQVKREQNDYNHENKNQPTAHLPPLGLKRMGATPEEAARTLVITSLPADVTHKEIRTFVERFGPMFVTHLCRQQDSEMFSPCHIASRPTSFPMLRNGGQHL